MSKQQSKRSSTAKISTGEHPRFLWARDVINPKKDDCILEIGCGVGILAGLLAEKVGSGKLVAIDRSASMIAKACKRNHDHILADRMLILQRECLDLNQVFEKYTAIVAFNVNVFLNPKAGEYQVLKQALKPDGRFYFFQQPPVADATLVARMKDAVLSNGFTIRKELSFETEPATCYAIVVDRQ